MSANKPHQRVGAKSNTQVGKDFEEAAYRFWRRRGIRLEREFPLDIGVSGKGKKRLKFDLGKEFDSGEDGKGIAIECKCHRWTTGDNSPSAKLNTWNVVMYYFSLCPKGYRKILFVAWDLSNKRGLTLAEYYIKRHGHLIPKDVEIWEYNEKTRRGRRVHPGEG